MSWLTRVGTAEPVSQDQLLRRARGHGKKVIFPVQLTTSRSGDFTRLIVTLAKCDDHTYAECEIHKKRAGLAAFSGWYILCYISDDLTYILSVLSTCPPHTSSGCGKERHISWTIVPSPSETWFRGMSVGGSFRRVWGRAHPQEMQPTGRHRDSACRLRHGGGRVG